MRREIEERGRGKREKRSKLNLEVVETTKDYCLNLSVTLMFLKVFFFLLPVLICKSHIYVGMYIRIGTDN